MFFRIPRLTPGYIRYLQTQATQNILHQQEGLIIPRMAMLLGLMGIGMSGYSTRQLTQHNKPCPHLFRLTTRETGQCRTTLKNIGSDNGFLITHLHPCKVKPLVAQI